MASRFTAAVPTSDTALELPRAAAPAPGAAPTRAARRVLIVDDNRDAAESLAMLVELLGYEAHVCFDGPAALASGAGFRPDIVLLDLSMPGMNGYEVARHWRAGEHAHRARLVLLSGRHEDDDDAKRQAGFDAHLVKPVDIGTLQSVLLAPTAS
ncbi:MAG TPA: response regulator [Casimicrobiaceae bacterium]|nr:response regulator [Casimicrobiaceae bacterium]